MNTTILNMGNVLNKEEQIKVNGGRPRFCHCDSDCGSGYHCCSNMCYSISAPDYPTGNCPPQPCLELE